MSDEEAQFNEEEEFGSDEEIVIEDDEDDELFFKDEELILQEQQIEENAIAEAEENKRKEEELNDSLVERFNPSSAAARRLINDLKIMLKEDPQKLGFSCEPINNNIFTWKVKLFKFEEGTPMMEDMKKYEKQFQ